MEDTISNLQNKIAILEKEVQTLQNQCKTLQSEKETAIVQSKQKTLFLANISHEIRTPLNTILGFSDLLSKDNISPDDRKEFSVCINEDGKMLSKLINDIIDIAKIESGQFEVKEKICDLNKTLKEIYSTFQKNLPKLKKENIVIKLNIPNRNTIISIDTQRIRQIVFNLITNALKFTNDGSIEFGYSFDVLQEGEKQKIAINFFVKDTGIGIPEHVGNKIFENFSQVKPTSSKEFGGTGLGLSIARRIVKLLGGNIWYESKINEGTIFYFSIPYNPVLKETSKNISKQKIESFDYKGKTILVAEDEEANYFLLKSIFQRVKAEVVWARDGQEAIDIFNSETKFDMIIMDIQMPNVSGSEATNVIKNKDDTVPIIALTAYAPLEYEDDLLKVKYDGFYTKPITPIKFLNYINEYF
ncbi:MAG: response regulator [Bacteroidetes bacterium]|jgi:signal transduction histidine kinase/CheY-like chemotaxis protein|nr:response regulator [Bacteroidota bacterium]MBT6687293.1 response regulator [Bacteroidota bacterium]MBT7143957.1 response regulator [Bacteroidota bacterium]MBT7491130.1 response regulator [Bacteroidota bacterium]